MQTTSSSTLLGEEGHGRLETLIEDDLNWPGWLCMPDQYRDALARLTDLDRSYQALVREGPSIPRNIGTALDTARAFLARSTELSDDPDAERSKLIRHWVIALRGNDPNLIQIHRKACASAAALSALVEQSKADPGDEIHFSHLSESDLEVFCGHANVLLANKDRWFIAKWWNGYGPAAAAIKGLAEIGNVADLAMSLLLHSKARSNRLALAEKNEALVPGVSPDRYSPIVQKQFPALAAESLGVAGDLLEQERACSFLKPYLDAFTERRTTTGEAQNLQKFIQKMDAAKKLMAELARMEQFLLADVLKQPEADVRAGKSIRSWIDLLSARYSSLSSLLLWEFDRRQRQPPVRAILECLEGYEQARTNGENLPAPPNDLPDDRYGEWWWALVETTSSKCWLAMSREKHPALLQFDPDQHEKKKETPATSRPAPSETLARTEENPRVVASKTTRSQERAVEQVLSAQREELQAIETGGRGEPTEGIAQSSSVLVDRSGHRSPDLPVGTGTI